LCPCLHLPPETWKCGIPRQAASRVRIPLAPRCAYRIRDFACGCDRNTAALPGHSDQARIHGLRESEVLDKVLLTSNAIRRLIEPEDVARAIAYLCTAESW
jgi:hypothetical protein